MRFFKITKATLPQFQAQLEALEQTATYPLGEDRFKISHGRDYFAFLERLGELHFFAAEDRGQIVACGGGVLMANPRRWYAADVKVHPTYRNQRLPLRMVRRFFFREYLRCQRGYAISMNASDGTVSKAVRMVRHFRWVPARGEQSLLIFSADADTLRRVRPIIEQHRGAVSFLSLAGKKDLVIERTQKPLALLHVQFGARAEPGLIEPQAEHVHMWCSPAADPLVGALAAAGVGASASATIVEGGLRDYDWRTILTSDI
jgi:hypothetical protein